ncbi:hypothetical protein MAAFP003_4599 [Mycobacterium ahvazicum]|uniref:ESX-1 secretion-associated protein EspA/EspE-like domain-containing protein n=1 Tax=Mycobacterium ahvazicum TaxID=1964395 RepID=A0A2K4YGK7_9MYCO|nr:EspA/EspE family type VII secretion system effector [Mycobacterium ahvazicum]SOX55903.1 hypothetical protein MAAFP003_4599 [Mycobacterium ahvazicum]
MVYSLNWGVSGAMGGFYDLGIVTDRFAVGLRGLLDGDSTLAGLNFAAAGAVGLYAWGKNELFSDAFLETTDRTTPNNWSPTLILDSCLITLVLTDHIGGSGTPDAGDEMAAGADLHETAQAQLASVVTGSAGWQGAAADAFTAQHAELRALTGEMAELDRQTQAQVQDQADAVTTFHRGMAGLILSIVVAKYVALVWYSYNPTRSMIFQAALSAATLASMGSIIGLTEKASRKVGDETQALNAKYLSVAERAAAVTGEFAKVYLPETQDTTIRQFGTALTGASELGVGAAPIRTSAAGRPNADLAELQSPALNTLSDDQSTSGVIAEEADASDARSIAVQGSPTLSRVMNRLVEMSGTAAEISSNLSAQLDVVDQIIDQVDKISGMAQDWQAAAPEEDATAEEPAPALAADTVGAAAGAEAVEGAPVEFAPVAQSELAQLAL